jgi:hypothetical protein
MSSISEWLDAAFIAFDNPQLKDYNAAKKLAGKKRQEAQKTPLQKYFEEETKRLGFEEQVDLTVKDPEVKKWQKKQEYKRNSKKPKLSHYDRVKRRLKKQSYEKRLKRIAKLKKEQNK